MNFIKALLLLSVGSLLFFSSCKKDELLTDSSAKLEFSKDTVLFDTVFTSVGSTTKSFMIYNKHSQPMNISKIYLGKGTSSAYLLNVDGVSGNTISDIDIAGGDSLFVFVQVFINPLSSASPLIVSDSVVFETNGNIQDVQLVAVGQDVYLHIPDHTLSNGLPYSLLGTQDMTVTLPNDKPHLFFGYTFIDSRSIVNIPQDTKCYFHKGAVLVAFDSATLNVQGDYGHEVTFQGDRLEPDYKEIPGQWGKIWFWAGSKNNSINYAIIKNGEIGVQVDSNVVATNAPTLVLTNTKILNMEAAAIYTTKAAQIRSYNCVFANCGQFDAALTQGGKFKFEHCTFADFWNISSRTTPILGLNNYSQSGSTIIVRPMDSCYFGNCIIYGDLDDEISMDTAEIAGQFSYKFDHCILKTTLTTSNTFYFDTPFSSSPAFVDVSSNDYHLTSSSAARDSGSHFVSVPFDLDHYIRDGNPDIGAYEFH